MGDTFGALEDFFYEISGDDNDHVVPKLFKVIGCKTCTHPSYEISLDRN
jgi:biotin synthase-related radical SAM superfamily protein